MDGCRSVQTFCAPNEGKVSRNLADIYTAEQNAEEIAIQKGGSCEVPEDFPR
jgi:hypothetical protein